MSSLFARHSDTLITLSTIIIAFVALVTFIDHRLSVQDKLIDMRFNAVDQRFDAQDRRIDDLKSDMNRRLDRLTDEVLELRNLTVGIIERVSRNEGEIDVIREQLQIADKPAPQE